MRPCGPDFSLGLIEALYLNDKVNIALPAEVRQQVIERAADAGKDTPEEAGQPATPKTCPLHRDGTCLLHRFRPIPCRLRGFADQDPRLAEIHEELDLLSRQVFSALFKEQADGSPPAVSCPDSVSGKFIQSYFHYLAAKKNSP